MVTRDAGKQGVPTLAQLLGRTEKLTAVIMLDATGFHSQQINTIAIRNPLRSASANALHYLGLGNCSDDRSGSTLLGPNLDRINRLIAEPRVSTDGGEVDLDLYFSFDVAALRHCEHLLCSGWCGCSRDFALRQTPKKPETIAEMHTLLRRCRCPSVEERFILSHNPLPGEDTLVEVLAQL
eukprot:7388959-Prymnesium_polylepis.2